MECAKRDVGKLPLLESAGVSKWVMMLVEEEYLFNTLQIDAVRKLASEIGRSEDEVFGSISDEGFGVARAWVRSKHWAEIKTGKTTLYDIPDKDAASEELAGILKRYLV